MEHQDRTEFSLVQRLLPPLVGGVCAIAVGLLLRSLIDSRLLAELVVDASTDTLRPRGFSFLISQLGPLGKPLLFSSVILGELALYVIVWPFITPRSNGLVAAAAAWVTLMLASLGMVELTAAQLGSQTSWYEYGLLTGVRCLAFSIVAATTVVTLFPSTDAAAEEAERPSRRRFVAALPVLVGGLALYIVGREVLKTGKGGVQSVGPSGMPTEEITPNEDFYVVSKNLFDPTVDSGSWSLKVGGEAENLIELTYADVMKLPAKEQYATLQCISNEVGGDLMSTALWRGTPMRNVLEMAGPKPNATHVFFRAADDFTQSLPLDFVMDESVMLAWEMNGVPLPDKHGYPLRVIAPGKYGFKGPKWITEIGLITSQTPGYWEKRGWDLVGRMNTSSRIDVPRSNTTVHAFPYRIHGLAFSGNRGISKVEVSIDNGSTWNEATLKPALSPYTWVLWYYDVDSKPDVSPMEIVARATDGDGEVQTSDVAPPYPAGATGYPHVLARIGSDA